MDQVVTKGRMNRLFNRFTRFCYSKYGLSILFVFILVNHLGLLKSPIFADDYIQNAYFQTDEAPNTAALRKIGILGDMPTGDFEFTLKNQFNFFDPTVGNDKTMMEYGALPWWTKDGILLHLFRPVASFTHWVDYQLWPNNFVMMHLHSIIIFMLGLFSVYALYKTLGLSKPVAMFALLLMGLDFGVMQALGWIAGRNAFLVWALASLVLLAYHKGVKNKYWYLLSLFLMVAALFTAEAAVSIAGYLGAYMFTLDRRKWHIRVLYILPFAITTILWRLWYQGEGYGSMHIGQYIDPGRSIVDFLIHGVSHYPILFWHLFAGTDGIEGVFNYDAINKFSLVAVIGLAILVALLLRVAKHQAIVRFLLLACFFSLVPGLALAYSDPRVLLIPSIAGLALIAVFVREVCLHSKTLFNHKTTRVVANIVLVYFLTIHVAISGFATIAGNMVLLTIPTSEGSRHKVYSDITNQEKLNVKDKRVIIANAPDIFGLMYLPYYYAYKGFDLPKSFRVLSSGLNQVSITRTGRSELTIEPYGGFIFHDSDPLLHKNPEEPASPSLHTIYPWKKMMNFFHNGEHDFDEGKKFVYDELQIEVLSVEQKRPMSIKVTFDSSQPLYWLQWSWQNKKFEPLSLPKLGETVILDGFFEGVTKKDKDSKS